MMSEHSPMESREPNSRRLVWILAGTGLLTGALMLLSVRLALTGTKRDRLVRDEAMSGIAKMQSAVSGWTTTAMSLSEELIDGVNVEKTVALDVKSQLRSVESHCTQTDTSRSDQIVEQLREFQQHLGSCWQFSEEYRAAQRDHAAAIKDCANSMRELSAAFESRKGIRMLRLTREVQRYRKLGGEAATRAADLIVKDIVPTISRDAVDKELADLALLCERLIGVDDADNLVDIKDNRFQPALARLRRTLEGEVVELSQRLLAFEKSVFGDGFRRDESHQILVPGKGGLYLSCLHSLGCNEEKKRLAAEGRRRVDRLRETQRHLQLEAEALTNSMARRAERSISRAWARMASIAACCSIAFVFLTRKIASMISAQVAAMNEQAVALRSEMKERAAAEKQREELNKRLQAAARQAGMAEVATGVLHNVGNVLNSVNVSANLIAERNQSPNVSILADAIGVLNDNSSDLGHFVTRDDRGKLLPTLLQQISEGLLKEQEARQSELNSMVANVEHIKSIVAMQQSFASSGGLIEPVRLNVLFEQAIKLNQASLKRHQVELTLSYDSAEWIMADKHQILQILVNLLKNGIEAVKEVDAEKRQIEIFTKDDGEYIEIGVRDNGIGIAPNDLARIFQHGFTTKASGHGFGLHSCANAAQQAGGALTAFSKGPQQGATFVLRLPMHRSAERHDEPVFAAALSS